MVEGGIHAGRDIIMGDQTNYSQINVHTQEELIGTLVNLRSEIKEFEKKTKLTPNQRRNLRQADADIMKLTELPSSELSAEILMTNLSDASDHIDLLSDEIQAAVSLGTTIRALTMLAAKFFR